ncbi:unnamed protein product [Rhizoctonia solani]|uniref:RNA polymerase II-associated protein 3 n=1 Tax=Rhizoctonia solani TaxID=456999 RepID=A0A8H3BWD2_9AGAM|nr:unnamed protein product [Rhizoctonia solani]
MAATEHKEKAPGDYPTAIGYYTSAILADGADPTFPLNRAAAYLKLNKNEDAERDCTTVLKLQANNVKALFRRAQARVALGKLQDARTDLVAAAKAEPGNAAVRTEFTKVEGLIVETAKKTKTGKGTPISLPTRAPDASEPSGTPYRRRVPIAIVNDDAPGKEGKEEIPKLNATLTGTTGPLKSILKNVSASPSDHQSTSQPAAPPVAPKSDSFLTPVSTRTLSPSEIPSQKTSTSPLAPSNPNPTRPSPASSAKPATPPIPSTTSALTHTVTNTASASLPNKATDDSSLTFPLQPDSTPPALLGFLQKWSNTRTDADRASVLFAVPPSSIPSLFGPTLESPLLGAMLSTLSWTLASVPNLPAADIPQRTLAYMNALAQVPRFSTLILFLDATEKKSAKDVWDGLEKSRAGVDLVKEKKKWGC